MNREPTTTVALDWFHAKQRGERLSAHELRCELCGELSEPPICGVCTETQLEGEVRQ